MPSTVRILIPARVPVPSRCPASTRNVTSTRSPASSTPVTRPAGTPATLTGVPVVSPAALANSATCSWVRARNTSCGTSTAASSNPAAVIAAIAPLRRALPGST